MTIGGREKFEIGIYDKSPSDSAPLEHINLPSNLPSGKFGPRVETSVFRSSCLR
jgi:hypothetical protein